MNTRAIPGGLSIVILIGFLAACSSTPRETRRPSVAIVISIGTGSRPSPQEIADLHKRMQPEIEERGYVMAESSRTADYFVHVRYPIDPIAVGRLVFVKAEPNVPFLREHETSRERTQRESKTAIAEMVREPK